MVSPHSELVELRTMGGLPRPSTGSGWGRAALRSLSSVFSFSPRGRRWRV